MISRTRQTLRFDTGIGFCVLRYRSRDAGYDLLRALDSAADLRVVISYARLGYDVLPALGSISCDIAHETEATICYGHWVLRLVMSHTRPGVRFVIGIGFCVL